MARPAGRRPRRRWPPAAAALAVVASAVVVLAGVAPAGAQEVPRFTAPVVDAAGAVPDDVEAAVSASLVDYQARSGNQVAVAVVATTGDRSIEDYGIDLARAWGVGEEGEDNGVVLVIAIEDRRLRIEVGRGLEGTLTDVQSGRIIRDRLVPLLRAGDVGAAVAQGAAAIRAELGDTEVGELPPVAAGGDEPEGASFPWAVLLIPALFALGAGAAGRRRGWRGLGYGPVIWGSGWGGGHGGGRSFGGGGFSGGGGGGFGGGGASGSW